jgi:hypothetical protein
MAADQESFSSAKLFIDAALTPPHPLGPLSPIIPTKDKATHHENSRDTLCWITRRYT